MIKKTIAILIPIACLTIANAKAGWIYLNPDYNYYGFRDREGVLHAWRAEQARYDNVTRDYQVLIRGHWLTVGIDVFQLTD